MRLIKRGTELNHRTGGFLLIAWAVLAGGVLSAGAASAQTLTTLVSFKYGSTGNPSAGLIADAHGNLFGTTIGPASGSRDGDGAVFEVAKTATGYAATPTILLSLTGTRLLAPFGGLIADASGNLFGTTARGGPFGYGTVFELAKTATGYAAAPTILATFNGHNGDYPMAGLIADANGNLFGTTYYGGASIEEGGGSLGSPGTVFELRRTASGYDTTPTTLVSFHGTDGANPNGGLIADANGNLFGTTTEGGPSGKGTIFELARTASGYAATPTTLVSFNESNGAFPYGGLIADANGNLFGTTYAGGGSDIGFDGSHGVGTVFEVAKTATGYAATPTTLVSFNGSNGASPLAGLIVDANGNLFGTTGYGGASFGQSRGAGTVFEVARTATGYAATPTTLVSFSYSFSYSYSDGNFPTAGLIADADGNLFGTTLVGGAFGAGTVFEVAGSGFVPSVSSFVYVADSSRVQKFTAAGVFVSQFAIAGDGRFPFGPAGLAVDAHGNTFLTDVANKNVSEFDSSGNFVRTFGSFGIGDGQFLGIGGLAIDPSGNVLVVDSGHDRIEQFSNTGVYVGQLGIRGQGNGQFVNPVGVATDSTGHVFVTDSSRVQEFTDGGEYLQQFSVSGNGGFLFGPGGVAMDATGNLFLIDPAAKNVIKFNQTGNPVQTLGSYGSDNGQFLNGLTSVAVDGVGNVLAGDSGNHRVQSFSANGGYESQFGTVGDGPGQFSVGPLFVAVAH